jgi:zona occludens toxin (predicted ATPase)
MSVKMIRSEATEQSERAKAGYSIWNVSIYSTFLLFFFLFFGMFLFILFSLILFGISATSFTIDIIFLCLIS